MHDSGLSYQSVSGDTYHANSFHETRSVFYGILGLLFTPVYPIVDLIILVKSFFKKKNKKERHVI